MAPPCDWRHQKACLALQRRIVALHVDDHGTNMPKHLQNRPVICSVRQQGKMHFVRLICRMAGADIFFDAIDRHHQPHVPRSPTGFPIFMDLFGWKLATPRLHRARLNPQLAQDEQQSRRLLLAIAHAAAEGTRWRIPAIAPRIFHLGVDQLLRGSH